MTTPDLALKVPIKGMIEWYERVMDSVDDDEKVKWTQYIQWPSQIITAMRCRINEKRLFTGRDVHEILANDARAFRKID